MQASDHPVLVTGASGCIGAWTVRELVDDGTPVVCFDLRDDRRRLRLIMDGAEVDSLTWAVGDISEFGDIEAVVTKHGVRSIIHLAALQVPFCRADPLAGARVNVGGFTNVLEICRRHPIARLVYASSIAGLPEDGPVKGFSTLYGAFKAADEAIANAYWHEFRVPSIGLRPAPIFGVGRDQGMTSLPTLAMLAAAIGEPFSIPFSGSLILQHAQDVARIAIRCLGLEVEEAQVYTLGGSAVTVAEVVAAIRHAAPDCQVVSTGDALPFLIELDEEPLRRDLGDWQPASPLARIKETVADFRLLHRRGLVGPGDISVSSSGVRSD